MKRPLSINPWIHDFGGFHFWLKPVEFLSPASILRKNHFEVTLLDLLDRRIPGLSR